MYYVEKRNKWEYLEETAKRLANSYNSYSIYQRLERLAQDLGMNTFDWIVRAKIERIVEKTLREYKRFY